MLSSTHFGFNVLHWEHFLTCQCGLVKHEVNEPFTYWSTCPLPAWTHFLCFTFFRMEHPWQCCSSLVQQPSNPAQKPSLCCLKPVPAPLYLYCWGQLMPGPCLFLCLVQPGLGLNSSTLWGGRSLGPRLFLHLVLIPSKRPACLSPPCLLCQLSSWLFFLSSLSILSPPSISELKKLQRSRSFWTCQARVTRDKDPWSFWAMWAGSLHPILTSDRIGLRIWWTFGSSGIFAAVSLG